MNLIKAFTDTDTYKFSTQKAIINKYPYADAIYEFIDRNDMDYPDGFDIALRAEIKKMEDLYLTEMEEQYMKIKCYYFDPAYIDFLKGYRFDSREVEVSMVNKKLKIVVRGKWYRTVLWEVPILATVSALYYVMTGKEPDFGTETRIIEKAKALYEMDARTADMATRRRFNFEVHDLVVRYFKNFMKEKFNGSSNFYLAMIHNVTPIGTQPHEWIMYHGAHFGYRMANHIALESWQDVYHSALGTALSDTYGSDDFFKAFSMKHCKLWDGTRQDSGDPLEYTDKTLFNYKKRLVEANPKTIVYSNNLNLIEVEKIQKYAEGKIRKAYGIGTFLGNDCGHKALNIVMKLTFVKPYGCDEFIPTVKLSDDYGKNMGSTDEIDICKRTLKINL